MSDSLTATQQMAGRKEWAGLAVLLLPTLLVALDVGALFLAVPHLSADLGASSVQQLWIADIYGFLLAGTLITMGSLGDRIGRRRLLMIGGAAFGVLSAVAAYSTGPAMLIVCRALLGVAGATLMPSTLALISTMFANDAQRRTAISAWATCQFAGAALGPVVGGILLDHFWWGSVFLMGVPVLAVLLVVGPIVLPEFKHTAGGGLDLVSVAFSLLAILPIIYGIKQLVAGDGDLPAVDVAAVILGVAFAVAFVRRQLRLPRPLLDLGLFAERRISVVLATMVLSGAAMAGTGLLVSQYLQSVLGYSPAQAALLYAPMGLGIAAGTVLSPVVVKRVSAGFAITAGLTLGVVGFVLIALSPSTGSPLFAVLGIAIIGLGDGPLVALGTGMVVSSAPSERVGSAAAMSETSLHLGGTVGMALLGTLGAAVYRSRMDGAVPGGLPPEAGRLVHETLAGAVAVAGEVGGPVGVKLLDDARAAFTSGLSMAAFVGAATFAVLVLLAVTNVRNIDAAPAADQN